MISTNLSVRSKTTATLTRWVKSRISLSEVRQVRNCYLVGLNDLAGGDDYVQEKIAEYFEVRLVCRDDNICESLGLREHGSGRLPSGCLQTYVASGYTGYDR